jgi:hypothetical protein
MDDRHDRHEQPVTDEIEEKQWEIHDFCLSPKGVCLFPDEIWMLLSLNLGGPMKQVKTQMSSAGKSSHFEVAAATSSRPKRSELSLYWTEEAIFDHF